MSRLDKYRKLPVFKKAEEILELAEVIVEAIKDSKEKEHFANEILSNAMLIGVKIAGAEGGGLYSLRMQNAVVVKIAVHDMLNAVICTAMFDLNEEDYVDLMRDKVEEFRLEFVEWIRSFDKKHDIPDNWAIRFDTSTPEQEVLEELMFDEEAFDDKFFEDLDDDESDDDDDENDDKKDEC
ncbi:hypothetical protein [Mucilaginibacter auburnensis]|uniref:Uncharacterized protein n=1 Tax=Mucilaginibacter auburnensis TaxID=1457233 RepID=A0A2H9VNJ9_9SPHI|nr:hypothetical protein [Mucilaginibacter auburnensis]PJJ79890.1 hypothetical protein CLV57_3029 [Mucilaginibacter auburnensis]